MAWIVLAWLCIGALVLFLRSPSAAAAAMAAGRARASNTMIPPAESQLSMEEVAEEDMTATREIVIIGSGPSGCTAAIYTARAMLKPLVIAGRSCCN